MRLYQGCKLAANWQYIDILAVEKSWSSSERDSHLHTPVLPCLESSAHIPEMVP